MPDNLLKTNTLLRPVAQWWHATPALAAIAYPFLLKGFHLAAATGTAVPAALLALAMAIPLLGFFVAFDLGKIALPDPAQRRLKRLAWLAVAAPPIFTADGVLSYMGGDTISDLALWLAFWILAAAWGVAALWRPARAVRGAPPAPANDGPHRLRVAHGVSALLILALFLVMHLTNHLAGLLSEARHRQWMDAFRFVYRAPVVEPLIVALFLFQALSGSALLHGLSARPADFFKSLQLASGAYLLFFILAHMNSVFLYARRFAGIKTDWDFATGAPAGLLHDAWNIRLVPHYYFGVFLVLAHLALAARALALAHGVAVRRADAATRLGIGAGAIIAALIMLGMSGVHLLR